MKDRKEMLAYCGFYCGDCLGHTEVIADAAMNFMNVLEKYRFDLTAKSVFPEKLKDYGKFREMVRFMIDLKCDKICREREDSSISCKVKKWCRDRGFYACYECGDFEICDKLKSLHGTLHYDSCIKNLNAIKEMGLERWIIRGKRYCYWDKIDEKR